METSRSCQPATHKKIVIELPIRDGNVLIGVDSAKTMIVIELPIRDGNFPEQYLSL